MLRWNSCFRFLRYFTLFLVQDDDDVDLGLDRDTIGKECGPEIRSRDPSVVTPQEGVRGTRHRVVSCVEHALGQGHGVRSAVTGHVRPTSVRREGRREVPTSTTPSPVPGFPQGSETCPTYPPGCYLWDDSDSRPRPEPLKPSRPLQQKFPTAPVEYLGCRPSGPSGLLSHPVVSVVLVPRARLLPSSTTRTELELFIVPYLPVTIPSFAESK